MMYPCLLKCTLGRVDNIGAREAANIMREAVCGTAGTAPLAVLYQWVAHQELDRLRRSSLLALDLQGQVPALHAGSYEPLRQIPCKLIRVQF